MKVLGIETSCDETAAGIVEDGRTLLSNIVLSQDELHKVYGGVVPELASRRHVEVILAVIQEALSRASLKLSDLDGLAVTQGPGLVGALLVGLNAAKAVSYASGLPLAGVNHLYGHASAGFLVDEPSFPLAAAVISGGHTNLYLVRGPLDFELLGRTRDDAAGEAYDKAAKLLGLGYPGGRIIDELAAAGNPERFKLPRPMSGQGLDFSFSGLKTALVQLVSSEFSSGVSDPTDLADLAAGFQAAVVDVVCEKIGLLLKKTGVKSLILSGGVASNRELRRKAALTAGKHGASLVLPPPHLCTDNGAMIAVVGYHMLKEGRTLDLAADAYSRWPAVA